MYRLITSTPMCSRRKRFGAARWVGGRCRPGFAGASDKGGQTGSRTQKCGAVLAGSAKRVPVGMGYTAAFFVGFDADLVVALFAVLALSFAANSCLTLAVIAATSTL